MLLLVLYPRIRPMDNEEARNAALHVLVCCHGADGMGAPFVNLRNTAGSRLLWQDHWKDNTSSVGQQRISLSLSLARFPRHGTDLNPLTLTTWDGLTTRSRVCRMGSSVVLSPIECREGKLGG